MKKIIITSLTIFATCWSATAQNTTNSPSSMFGLGDLSTGEGGVYAGMGGVSMALRAPNFLNVANPASLTSIGSEKFLIDVGVMGGWKEYSQSNKKNSSMIGNINNIGIAARILPRWYAAVSLTPVSSVGYNITLETPVEGTNNGYVTSLFEGEGGLSKIGISNAFLITKRLSAGINLSYITGNVKQTETQEGASITEESDKSSWYADFGLQYNHPLGIDRSFTIGAVYGMSSFIEQDNTRSVYNSSGGDPINEEERAVKQYMPQYFGGGAAYNSLRWTVTAEYKYIDWSKMKSQQSGIRFDNQHRVAIGAAYKLGNPYKTPVQLMLGAGTYNSYVVIRNEKPQNVYVSTGLGFYLKNNTIVTVGAKYCDQVNVSASTQKERSASLFLNVAFGERSYRAKLK